jgi:hypothetical protein
MHLTLAIALALGGCTATLATVHLVTARDAVQRAELHHAPERAPYEYTMAVELLAKARAEAAHAGHGNAVDLAREAAEWADRATMRSDAAPTAEVQP